MVWTLSLSVVTACFRMTWAGSGISAVDGWFAVSKHPSADNAPAAGGDEPDQAHYNHLPIEDLAHDSPEEHR